MTLVNTLTRALIITATYYDTDPDLQRYVRREITLTPGASVTFPGACRVDWVEL